MSEKVYFPNMFPDYEPPEVLIGALSQAAIVAADIDPITRYVNVALFMEQYVPKRLLDQVAKDLTLMYGLSKVELIATHPETELSKIEPEELRDLFVAQNSMTRGTLAGAKWTWQGTELHIQLLANGKKELEEIVPHVQNHLREQFATPVTIHIEAGEALEGKALFEAMESMRAQLMENLPASVPAPKKEEKPVQQSETFFGKPFKGDVVPMKDLNLDMGFVIVEGRVFNVEHKELKKRNAWVIGFDMTDDTNSVHINRFMEAGEAKPILENVKVGSVLKVQGKLELNRYDNEMVLKPFAMMPGSLPKLFI